MDDPLTSLEERLEQLVPRGLSDSGRVRLDEQIERLAAETDTKSVRRGRGWWWGSGIAAALAGVAAFLMWGDSEAPENQRGQGVAAVSPSDADDFETDLVERTPVGVGQYDGIVLDTYDEAKHSWIQPMRVTELVRHKETGLQVRIMQESREVLRVDVSSF